MFDSHVIRAFIKIIWPKIQSKVMMISTIKSYRTIFSSEVIMEIFRAYELTGHDSWLFSELIEGSIQSEHDREKSGLILAFRSRKL